MNTEEKEKLVDAIYAKQQQEIRYWVDSHLGELECRNFSIHQVDQGGVWVTIVYDIDCPNAVLIETYQTAPTVKESHKYMLIDENVIAKLAALYNASK